MVAFFVVSLSSTVVEVFCQHIEESDVQKKVTASANGKTVNYLDKSRFLFF